MKIKILIYLHCLALMLGGCRKPEVNEYYPKVSTINAEVQTDGSLKVEGFIENEGEAKIDLLGFCISEEPVPSMNDNQIIVENISGKSFTATYSGLELNKRYYLRTWASNAYGYSYGNIIDLDTLKIPNIQSPCNPINNTVNLGLGQPNDTYGPFYATDFASTWVLDAVANGVHYYFKFARKPGTGVYTTEISGLPGSKDVDIVLYRNFTDYDVDAGSKVYVNQIGADTYQITVCNAPFDYILGQKAKLTTRFTYTK